MTGPEGPHNPANAAYRQRLLDLREALGLRGAAHFAAEDFPAALQQAKRTALSRPQLQSGIIWAASAAALDDRSEAQAALEYCLTQRSDLTVSAVVPRFMLRFAREADHARLLAMLRKAGLPE